MRVSNYTKGRRFEYDRKAYYEDILKADAVIRAAGSHGVFDLVIFRKGHVTGVQCKVVDDPAEAKRMLERFRSNPPLTPSSHYHQTLEVKISGSTEVHSVTI